MKNVTPIEICGTAYLPTIRWSQGMRVHESDTMSRRTTNNMERHTNNTRTAVIRW